MLLERFFDAPQVLGNMFELGASVRLSFRERDTFRMRLMIETKSPIEKPKGAAIAKDWLETILPWMSIVFSFYLRRIWALRSEIRYCLKLARQCL